MKPVPQILRNLLHSFLVALLFSPSTLHPLASLSCTFPSCTLRIFQHFPYKVASFSSGLQRHEAYSEHFLHLTKPSPFGSTLLTVLFSSDCSFSHLFSLELNYMHIHFGPSHFPGIFIFLLFLPASRATVSAGGCTPLGGMFLSLSLLSTAIHFSFGFGLKKSSQSLHSTTKQGKLTEQCNAA